MDLFDALNDAHADQEQATAQAQADAAPDASERLYLADAMALAYRAHFAFINRPLINTKGQDTSAVYGFAISLLKLLEDHRPEHIAVVFDALDGPPNFRDQLYEDYKAHRPPMPEGLKDGIPYIKELVRAFDIPVLEVPGVEADDVIGTLSKQAATEGVDVIIVSPDKDFRQLLQDDKSDNGGHGAISMLRPAYKGEEFDLETADTFRETYGVEPHQFIDILALLGDASDNVPGVRGIGKKGAPKLIQEYGTVENLLNHAEDQKGKRVREGLLNHRDDAILSKKLVTILTDIDFDEHGQDVDWHRLRRTDPHLDRVEELFDELEFGNRLRKRIKDYHDGKERVRKPDLLPEDDPALSFDFGPYEPVKEMDQDRVDYKTALSIEAVARAHAHVADADRFALDTETSSLDAMETDLVGVSLSAQAREAHYVPTPLPDGTQTAALLDTLRPALTNDALKVGHNLKFDLVVLAEHGLEVRGPLFDTMVAHYLIEPEASHKMDDVSSFYLSYRPQPITDLIGTGKNAKSMRDVPIDQVGPYACEDADITFRLMDVLKAKLDEDGLLAIAEEIEFPLIRVLVEIERHGVRVDPKILEPISTQLGDEMARVEAEVYEAVGRTFNVGSPKQLGEALFNNPPTDEQREAARVWAEEVKDPKAAGKTKKQLKEEEPTFGLGLDHKGQTASGQYKTSEAILEEVTTESDHPVPRLALDWRKLSKLKNTYVDKLPELINPATGRIHTDFNQTVTATGRLSSSNPNLQNIPVRTEQGREIRRAFVADQGFKLLAADYAQIELRILAHLSGDPGLIEAFQQGLDIHTATAARVFDVDLADVTRIQRSQVKQVNYGIPYGVSAFGLAQRMRIPVGEAQELIEQYNRSYPRVVEYLTELVAVAREKGYAETLRGRRRYLPQITSRDHRDRSFAERVAVNMPIQGTQADMIKLAMVAIHRRLKAEQLATRMILQVHDELVFEVPDGSEDHPNEIERATALIREEMAQAQPLGVVPVVVDIGIADNWLDAH
ncbi:MAG: DNA polymerase I [Bacteroidota bacterium]